MRLSIGLVLLLWPSYTSAQVAVVDSATRAELVDGRTTISVALKNTSTKTQDVRVRLRWLSPTGTIDRETWGNASIRPGDSTLSITHPLDAKSDPLMERLEYGLYPAERNYTA